MCGSEKGERWQDHFTGELEYTHGQDESRGAGGNGYGVRNSEAFGYGLFEAGDDGGVGDESAAVAGRVLSEDIAQRWQAGFEKSEGQLEVPFSLRSLADYAGWSSVGYDVGRDVFENRRACSDHRVLADLDAVYNTRTHADGGVFADGDVASGDGSWEEAGVVGEFAVVFEDCVCVDDAVFAGACAAVDGGSCHDYGAVAERCGLGDGCGGMDGGDELEVWSDGFDFCGDCGAGPVVADGDDACVSDVWDILFTPEDGIVEDGFGKWLLCVDQSD